MKLALLCPCVLYSTKLSHPCFIFLRLSCRKLRMVQVCRPFAFISAIHGRVRGLVDSDYDEFGHDVLVCLISN